MSALKTETSPHASPSTAGGGTTAVILAAGKSTRMKSALPKVVHEICGRPVIEYVIEAVRAAGVSRIALVVGHAAGVVQSLLRDQPDLDFVLQAEQRGTGHALMVCRDYLRSRPGPVLVLLGDTPLIKSASLRGLLEEREQAQAACVIGTAVTSANEGLGRIVRDAEGRFQRIVEHKDASESERAIREINTGCYAFDGESLLAALDQLKPNNKQGEYYLTDCPAILLAAGRTVLAVARFDIEEAMGINTREQLADVERSMQHATHRKLMQGGVTIVSPEMTYIDPRAEIGAETIVYPFTTITGAAHIGPNCRIGPHAVVHGPVDVPANMIVPAFGAVSDDERSG